MLVIPCIFENGTFVPETPEILPFSEKARVMINVEENGELPFIPKEAWDTFRKELEEIDGEDLPEDFSERFKLTNFRTPEELGLL
jgi:hypothetical protein